MSVAVRIEAALERCFPTSESADQPPLLTEALRYAVFPGGARIRPRLTLAVAAACGDSAGELADAAAAAVELMHCASLVHDDLPCFDDAALRRGRPALHRRFNDRIAVLTGDALIVLAFRALAVPTLRPDRLPSLLAILSEAVGAAKGIIAGQAWECEPAADVDCYHRQKTGALFAGAAMLGAAACGEDPADWRALGQALGIAYQAADDIADAASDSSALGKPIGQDVAFGRPSVVAQFGLVGACRRFDDMVDEAIALVPRCPGASDLERLIATESRHLLPKHLWQRAA